MDIHSGYTKMLNANWFGVLKIDNSVTHKSLLPQTTVILCVDDRDRAYP